MVQKKKKTWFILLQQNRNNMNTTQKRFALFLFGCIPVRLLFLYLAAYGSAATLKLLSIVAAIISFGFFYIFFTGSREKGFETFNQPIWWNNLRPVHGVLYMMFAYQAFHGNKQAYVFLAIDVLLGFISFLVFHYKNGDFSKLRS